MTSPFMETDNPYRHAPLGLASESIRLVELQPCGLLDTIRCRLRSHPIQPDCPPYVALSYKWGPKQPFDNIELNGVPFSVGQSLWTFLHQMRLQDSFGTYWIDAICINQANFEERNHQVKLMRQIYSNAQSVSIWLGEREAQSPIDVAMDLIAEQQLNYHAKKYYTTEWTDQNMRPIRALCNNEYWRRIWVIQEVVLAKEPIIHYGPKTAAFGMLSVILLHVSFDHIDLQIASTSSISLLRHITLAHQPFDLTSLVFLFSAHEATVVHDKVYALLGLADQGDSSIDVDYQSSPTELLLQVIAHICSTEPAEYKTVGLVNGVGKFLAACLEVEWPEEEVNRYIVNNTQMQLASINETTLQSSMPPRLKSRTENQVHLDKGQALQHEIILRWVSDTREC